MEQPIGYNGKGDITTNERDEAEKELHLGGEFHPPPVEEREVGHDKEQKDEVVPEIPPRIVSIVHLHAKQEDKQHAYPELQVQVVGIIVEGDTVKRVDGYADDQQ